MRLHCGIGPNSYRVRIFLAEKGIDVPKVEVNIMNGEHLSPDYRRINSLAQIPALELDDGTVITESVAICRYFEALHPATPLFGATPVEKGLVKMWNRRAELEIFATIGSIPFHTDELFAHRLTQFPAFAETQRAAVPGKWAWLDRELADGRRFLAGDSFSVADITGAVAAWVGEFFDTERPAELKNVARWLDAVRSRPSWNA